MEDKEKMDIIRKREPFNFGIKELKRVLTRMDMPKAEKNKTIRLYKERLYTRIDEVKEKMDAVKPLPDEQGSLGDAKASESTNLADMIEMGEEDAPQPSVKENEEKPNATDK